MIAVMGKPVVYHKKPIQAAADDIGGVWRTINGTPVFIKEGQDIKEAIKEKFGDESKGESGGEKEGEKWTGAKGSGHHQTDNPKFKAWFGDSKVVDADGKPLVVYHGTTANFDTFSPSRIKEGNYGLGFYFSSDPEDGTSHFRSAGTNDRSVMDTPSGANVMPVYLAISNPASARQYEELFYEKSKGTARTAASNKRVTEIVTRELRKQGYDGVVVERGYKKDGKPLVVTKRWYTAFSPTQIKSAIGNKGTWSKKDPNITASEPIRAAIFSRPVIFQEALDSFAVKQILPSSGIEGLGKDIYQRAFTIAHVEEAKTLDHFYKGIKEVLEGRNNPSDIRLAYNRMVEEEGGEPLSAGRQELIINTNLATARGYGQMMKQNDPDIVDAWPALELIRGGQREYPRGDPHYKEGTDGSYDWDDRWQDALDECDDDPADVDATQKVFTETGRRIALKDSSIWQALGDGAGGRGDTLGNPFPPFAFESGMVTENVSREECEELGLLDALDTADAADLPDLNDGYEQDMDIDFKPLLGIVDAIVGSLAGWRLAKKDNKTVVEKV